MKWTPELIIALVIIVLCGALMLLKIDGEVKGIMAVAAGWAFRSQVTGKTATPPAPAP